jgi:hypothetical protein
MKLHQPKEQKNITQFYALGFYFFLLKETRRFTSQTISSFLWSILERSPKNPFLEKPWQWTLPFPDDLYFSRYYRNFIRTHVTFWGNYVSWYENVSLTGSWVLHHNDEQKRKIAFSRLCMKMSRKKEKTQIFALFKFQWSRIKDSSEWWIAERIIWCLLPMKGRWHSLRKKALGGLLGGWFRMGIWKLEWQHVHGEMRVELQVVWEQENENKSSIERDEWLLWCFELISRVFFDLPSEIQEVYLVEIAQGFCGMIWRLWRFLWVYLRCKWKWK